MSFLAVLILLIPSMVYASHESEKNLEENESCIFTAFIEKSWVFFQDRPWVSGFVNSCDAYHYFEKDQIFVRILDINGNTVSDSWKPYNTKAYPLEPPSLYEFTTYVYRGGARGGTNVESAELIHIRPNQYFFYMPQINSIDFDHRGIYQIELRYGDNIRTIWFVTLSPNIWWEDDEVVKDLCIYYKDNLIRKNNTLDSLHKRLLVLENIGQTEKYEHQLNIIQDMEKKIRELEKCHD